MTTKILYQLNQKNNFKSIIIKGHTNYAEKGKDIICAAISAITNGTISFLQTYYKNDCRISYLPAEIEIYSRNNNSEFQLCLRLMFFQLENIANSYPNYLEIQRE